MNEGFIKLIAAACLLIATAANPFSQALRQAPSNCEALPPSLKVDEYGDVKPFEEHARLDKLVAALNAEDEEAKAFIMAYAGRGGRRGEAWARVDRAKEYLTEKSVFYNTRINTLDCGHRESPATELWITRVGAAPPRCTPTVGPGKAQVKARKARQPLRRRSRAL